MKTFAWLLISCCCLCCCFSTNEFEANRPQDSAIANGITVVSPPRPMQENPMIKISQLNANWIALNPFGFTPEDEAAVYFNRDRQWWGEKPEGIIHCIQMAHQSNLKVLLKPHIWARGRWCGDIRYDSEAEWQQWESDYIQYIQSFAKVADSMKVELFCIGTELKQFVIHRPQFWQTVIDSVKAVYSGPLTYAANWDEYNLVEFWDQLDYIGVNAYFPLVEGRAPSKKELLAAWKPIRKSLNSFRKKWGKDILFTEYGYLSTEYNAHNTWEKEDRISELLASQEAQKVAIDALYQAFHSAHWWYGGFLWKWFPDSYRKSRHWDKDYTPQGKSAEEVLQYWYSKN